MIVVVGLDGTVCDDAWRRPLIEQEGWDVYHSECLRDPPIAAMREMIAALDAAGHEVVALTSRPERWRQATNQWLSRHVLIDEVKMRAEGDFRPASQVKLDMVRSLGVEVSLAVDDRDDVVAAYRGAGICCLQLSR